MSHAKDLEKMARRWIAVAADTAKDTERIMGTAYTDTTHFQDGVVTGMNICARELIAYIERELE